MLEKPDTKKTGGVSSSSFRNSFRLLYSGALAMTDRIRPSKRRSSESAQAVKVVGQSIMLGENHGTTAHTSALEVGRAESTIRLRLHHKGSPRMFGSKCLQSDNKAVRGDVETQPVVSPAMDDTPNAGIPSPSKEIFELQKKAVPEVGDVGKFIVHGKCKTDVGNVNSWSDKQLVDHYVFDKEIGFGNWGSCWLTSARKGSRAVVAGRLYVAKMVHRQGTSDSTARVKALWNEFKVLRSCGGEMHPNIVHFKEFAITPSFAMLVMDYYRQPMQVNLSESTYGGSSGYFQQLLSSLAWLHERNVTHCDIKVSNLLVDIEADPVRGRPMLVDFGFATLHDSTTNFMSSRTWGTPEYLSPERSRGDYHDERLSDVWALGVTFFELATGRTPFERENEQFLTKEELQVYYMRTQTSRWVGHWYISESLEMLCRLMLEPDPARRIYASEALHHPFFLEENPTYDLGDVDDSQVTSADSLYLSTLQASAKMSWAAEQRRMDIGVERNGEESIALHHGAGAHGYAHGHESRYPSIPSQLDSFEHLPLPHTEADASALEHTPPAKPPKDSRREQVRIIVDETVEGDDETPERDCGRFAAQTEVLGKGEPKRGIAMSEANAIGRLLQKGGALTEKVNGRSADTFADAERGLDLDQRENESPMTSGNQLSAQMMVERAGTTTSEHLRTRQNLDYLFARPITVHGAQFDMNTSHGRWGEPKHLEKHTASDDAAVPQLVIPKRASALGSKLFDDRQSNRNGAQHGTIHEGNETAEPCEEVYGPDAHHNQLTLDAARRGYAITSPPGLTTIGTPSDSHSAGLRYDERKYQEMKEIKRRVEEFKRMPWLQSNQTSAINPDYGPEELHRMLIELDQLTVTLTDIVRQTHSALDRYYHRNINCSASAYDHNISHSDDQHHPRPLALGAPEKKHKRHISLSKLQLFGARKQSNTSRRHMASPHVPLAAHRFPPPGLTPPLLGETGYAYVKGVKAWPNNPMVSPTMLSDIICSSMGFPPPVQQSMPCSSTSTTLLNRQSSMNSATSCIVHPTPSTYAHKGCYCASKPSPAIQDATQAAHPERNASCTGVTANIMEPAASNEPLTTACKVDAEGPRPYDSPVPVDMQAQMGGETNCNPVGNKLVSKFGRAAAEEVSPPAQAKPVHIPYTNTMKGKLSKVKSFTLGRSRSINIVGAHRNSEVKSGEKRRNTAAELVRGYHATKYGPQTIHRADVSAGRHMPDTPPTFGTPNNVQQALSAGQTWTQPRPVLDPIMTQSSYRSGASPCAGTIFAAPSHYPGQAYGVCPTSSHRPLIAEDPPHPQPSTRSFESAFKTPVSPTSGGSLWRMLTSRVSNSRNGGR